MEANKIRLLEFIGSSKRTFNIPVYQRNYDWRAEHCRRLFHDVEQIALNNFETDHFLGTIVYVISSAQPTFMEFVLIDGQQRITSSMLFIKAIHDSLEDPELKEDIYESYLINKRAPELFRVKLKPIESDMPAYKRIINNEQSNTSNNIEKNYRLFIDLIMNSSVSAKDLYTALNNIEIVYISLEKNKKSENPQLIFESLNSTGLSLTQADLIRNFLLMNHSYNEQTRLYKDYWLQIESLLTNANISDFVRDYLTMKSGTIPTKDKVYGSFKEFAKHSKWEEDILKDLLLYCEYYSWFIFSNSPMKKINTLLHQFQQLKSTVTYPTLLYIFHDCFNEKKMEVSGLENILKLTLSYLFRRLICEYPTNTLNKIFASMPNEIYKNLSNDYYEAVVEVFSQKTGGSVFPRDDEFKKAFVIKNLYKTKIDRYTLAQLENYRNKEMVDLNSDISVEHIMPQKLTPVWRIELGNKYNEIHSEYLHSIGNLTLTGYNPELSNKAFSEKKKILSDSNISISRSLSQFDIWNEETIKERANELFSIALNIWGIPEQFKLIEPGVSQINYDVVYNIMDDIDVTGEKPRKLFIMNAEATVTSWKDILRELSSQLYYLDSSIFESFTKHTDFEGRSKRIISNNPEGMNSPHQLSENIYIETNLNANTLINYCRLMAEKYEMQDDISFLLRP